MTEQHLLMLQGAAIFAAACLPSLFTALFPHPSERASRIESACLLLLGRLSVLDHGVGLRWPFIAKWSPTAPPAMPAPTCPECGGDLGRSGRILHEPGCGSVPVRTVIVSAAPAADLARATATTIPEFPAMTTAPKIVGALALLLCFGLALSACLGSALDRARVEYTNALKVASATNTRFRAQSVDFQRKNIERLGAHTPAALAWQGEFVVKRKPVEDQITRCQEILDSARDLLLLADDAKGPQAAKSSTACVASLRDMMDKLFDGGL